MTYLLDKEGRSLYVETDKRLSSFTIDKKISFHTDSSGNQCYNWLLVGPMLAKNGVKGFLVMVGLFQFFTAKKLLTLPEIKLS